MPEFPAYKGRYKVRHEDTAEFGLGVTRFTITAYGLDNLLFNLLEIKESLRYAIDDVRKQIELKEGE